MPFLPASGGREIAWKNGGGFTREIAAHPAGAGYEAFDWRVSLARIARDGPFSAFPGVDRLFAVVEGAGLCLEVEGAPPLRLDSDSAPVAFAGESRVFARLVDGEVVALNVMTRRVATRATLTIDELACSLVLPCGDGAQLWLALAGAGILDTGRRRHAFQPGDAWLGEDTPQTVSPRPNDRLRLARIAIS